MTLSWSTTFRTNSHSSFDFNFFAFNPWELYTQRYIKNKYNNNSEFNSAFLQETSKKLSLKRSIANRFGLV